MNLKTRDFLNNNAILNSVIIGFEFEFFCKKGFTKVAKELSEILEKKVTAAYKTDPSGKKIPGAHTEMKVSYYEYKLEHDFSGGPAMMELVTGPTPYYEAKIILAKVLNYIKDNGKTTARSGIHVNISFDGFKTPDKSINMTSLDPLKLILSYDENNIFDKFPERIDNVFAKSIDFVLPNNLFSFTDNVKSINRSSFTVPTEKYFGFNFSKLEFGYIEMRYMGGRDYEEKIDEIISLIDYTCLVIYGCLRAPLFDQENVDRLRQRMIEHKKFVNSIVNNRVFKVMYPKIKVFVDLKDDDQVLATYWNEIRNVLFDLIYTNGLKSGLINLDNDLHRYQVKDGKFSRSWRMADMDFVDCSIKGAILEQCTFIGCKIKDSQLFFSNISLDNQIDSSKIKSCHIATPHNKFFDCYIDNAPHNVKGELKKCIVRSGDVSELSEIDDKTSIMHL